MIHYAEFIPVYLPKCGLSPTNQPGGGLYLIMPWVSRDFLITHHNVQLVLLSQKGAVVFSTGKTVSRHLNTKEQMFAHWVTRDRRVTELFWECGGGTRVIMYSCPNFLFFSWLKHVHANRTEHSSWADLSGSSTNKQHGTVSRLWSLWNVGLQLLIYLTFFVTQRGFEQPLCLLFLFTACYHRCLTSKKKNFFFQKYSGEIKT